MSKRPTATPTMEPPQKRHRKNSGNAFQEFFNANALSGIEARNDLESYCYSLRGNLPAKVQEQRSSALALCEKNADPMIYIKAQQELANLMMKSRLKSMKDRQLKEHEMQVEMHEEEAMKLEEIHCTEH